MGVGRLHAMFVSPILFSYPAWVLTSPCSSSWDLTHLNTFPNRTYQLSIESMRIIKNAVTPPSPRPTPGPSAMPSQDGTSTKRKAEVLLAAPARRPFPLPPRALASTSHQHSNSRSDKDSLRPSVVTTTADESISPARTTLSPTYTEDEGEVEKEMVKIDDMYCD